MSVYNQSDFSNAFEMADQLRNQFNSLDENESIFKVNLISKGIREAANDMSVIMQDLTRQGLLTNQNQQMWGAVKNLQKKVDEKIHKMLLSFKN